jgi:hypothetical protein
VHNVEQEFMGGDVGVVVRLHGAPV